MRAPTRPKRPAVHRRHRVLKVLVVLVAICVVITSVAYVYVRIQLGNINRLDLPGVGDDGADQVMNVLLVGSDSRDRLTGEAAAQAGKGEVQGSRSDTIMVLHVDPRQTKAMILSVPRDLFVPIAGRRNRDRINTAFSLGGAEGLVRTIESALDIPIHHYVEIDFVGFKDVVDAVGGVRLYIPAPARDRFSGLNLPTPGCLRLDGTQGLAFVRSRNYETFESGRWRLDPTGDLGRIQRQQDFIRRMLRKAVSSGISNPVTLNRLVGIGVQDVTLDSKMSTRDIVRLARRFRSLDPNTVDMLTLPTRAANVGGASVLLLKEAEARPYVDRLNGRGAPPPAAAQPGDVRVQVLNGYGADGAASGAKVDLQEAGFSVAGSGDADRFTYRQTEIRYLEGKRGAAELVKSWIVGPAVLKQAGTTGTADATLVLGADWRGVKATPGAPVTTGTAAPSGTAPQARGTSQPTC